MVETCKIAVVGDVHDCWNPQDHTALHGLGVDLVLLVGDFGNESVEVVGQIASLDLPKAVVLGNHDAWYSLAKWQPCPYDRSREDRVQQQLDLLGPVHVGYGALDFPHLELTVVGSRPFSWGGIPWLNRDFYQQRYGVTTPDQSTTKIIGALERAAHRTIIFLGHCGPAGLGSQPHDICGRDWPPVGGDHGDLDFADAIAYAQSTGYQIPLVAFGHMHHQLRHTRTRERTRLHQGPSGTVYLNAARVPRIRHTNQGPEHNFSLVSLTDGKVTEVSLVWASPEGQVMARESLLGPGQTSPTSASTNPRTSCP